MKTTFPLIRLKWSDIQIMTALFCVLLLYHIPKWIAEPFGLLKFIILLTIGLIIDTVINLLRFKKLTCAVSAAVTVGVLSILTQGISIWVQILGVIASLVVGKHVWGGTGKNLTNPAMIGMLFILPFWTVPFPFVDANSLLLPAIILGLPFILFRPYISISYILTMLTVMWIRDDLSYSAILTSGIFFWSSIVLTDPVTVSSKKVFGMVSGIFLGLISYWFDTKPIMLVNSTLVVNMISYWITTFAFPTSDKLTSKLKIRKVVPQITDSSQIIDLSMEEDAVVNEETLSADEILSRIQNNGVFGMGGGAFSTYEKINAVIEANASRKYLIVNGLECDPGLIHDDWLLKNHAYEIEKGVELLKKCISFYSVSLAVKESAQVKFKNLPIIRIKDLYPAGAEKILISQVLNIKLNSKDIPSKNGILVLNVQTVYSIYKAVYQNIKVDTKYLTIANLHEMNAKVVKVKLGTKIREVMDKIYPGTSYIFAGGGMMNAVIADDDAIVDEHVNYLATSSLPVYWEKSMCSKCGLCKKFCPSELKVYMIAECVEDGRMQDAKKYHPNQCIGCGSCSYICLARKNLSAIVKQAKAQ